MTLPNIVEESQKLFELLQNCKDPLSLGHELKSLQRQFEATHRLLIVRGIDIPKVENKPLTLISPTNFEASEEARQIYEFLFYKASELGNKLTVLRVIDVAFCKTFSDITCSDKFDQVSK